MTPQQILSLGSQLADFLDEFDDCFARSEPRGHLASYVRGQLADLRARACSSSRISAVRHVGLCKNSSVGPTGTTL